MERRLLVATGNPGKVLELAELLRGVPYTLVSLRDLGLPTEIEEPADTFEGNAVIKAETYARMSGLLTMADDSGLEVDALDGAPGVHSKRFAGDDASDDDRTALVLRRLGQTPWERRTARYRCVLALAAPGEPRSPVRACVLVSLSMDPEAMVALAMTPSSICPSSERRWRSSPSRRRTG